jgi:hypothetical protein
MMILHTHARMHPCASLRLVLIRDGFRVPTFTGSGSGAGREVGRGGWEPTDASCPGLGESGKYACRAAWLGANEETLGCFTLSDFI